ncbi:MAG: gliding motility-associated C-terminal domain-containing protein [Bacteroidetes bacterium]|nr:gliding motility-associated C-terminal domain-containing protein [Bacteroidota bacterium]
MKQIHRFIIIIDLVFSVYSSFSQKEYSNWYFGNNAGITFNSGTPIPLNNGASFQGEGCASISDSSGNLLFYTNGWEIFNRLHQHMPNAFGLTGSTTTTQSALIIPKPLCNRYYYVFTLSPQAGSPGLRYSIVDMQACGGLGDVVEKNILLLSPSTEKITAIRHANGVDIWIIAHGWNNNWFYAYRLSPSGLDMTPVISTIGTVYGDPPGSLNGCSAGYLKPSPKGNLIVSAVSTLNIYELFKFDKLSGNISSPIIVHLNDSATIEFGPYGAEFSPDGKFIFLKNVLGECIYQYAIDVYDSLYIINSSTCIGSVNPSGLPPYHTGALQQGPDGKIYIALYHVPFLGVINSPNNVGTNCGLQDCGIDLNGNLCLYGLPNNPFTAPYIQYHGCYTGKYTFYLTDTTPYQHWDFGVQWEQNDTADQANPSYTFTQPGTYLVTTVYQTDWNTIDTATTTVYVYPIPNIIAKDTIIVCGQDTALLSADSSFDFYQWSNGEHSPGTKVVTPGVYYVTVSNCSCSLTDSVVVVIRHPLNLVTDTTFCEGTALHLDAEVENAAYQWSNGLTTQGIDIQSEGIYWVKVIEENCIRTDTINVLKIPLSLNLGEDTLLCEGQEIILRAMGIFDSCIWYDGYTGITHLINQPGNYYAIAKRAYCLVTDSITFKPCSVIRFPNVFTPNGDHFNDVFLPESKEITGYRLEIYDRWGVKLFTSEDVQTGWDGTYKGNDCLPGTYFYISSYDVTDNEGTKKSISRGSVMLVR